MPVGVKRGLNWWKDPHNIFTGISFAQPSPTLIIMADASLLGWGVHLGTLTAQGRWSPLETTLHINLLELRVVRNACLYFLLLRREKCKKIMRDDVVHVVPP